jgi:hypothetical protein
VVAETGLVNQKLLTLISVAAGNYIGNASRSMVDAQGVTDRIQPYRVAKTARAMIRCGGQSGSQISIAHTTVARRFRRSLPLAGKNEQGPTATLAFVASMAI